MISKIHALLLCSFLLFITNLNAQEQETDLNKLTFAELDTKIGASAADLDYERAIAYSEQGMKKAKAAFGEIDSTFAVYAIKCLSFYFSSGQYQKAEEIGAKSLEIVEKKLGKQHYMYATTLNHLALLAQTKGDTEKAEALFLQDIAIKKDYYGPSHVDYAGSLCNLGVLYDDLGRYDEAEALYFQTKEIRKKNLGELSAPYADVLRNLALMYHNTGKYQKAKNLYTKTLEIEEVVLGEMHTDHATTLNNFSYLYWSLGEYEKVEPLLLKAKKIWRKILGDTHPDYAATLGNLAVLYGEMGRYEEAEPMYLQALAIEKTYLGEDSPDYAQSMANFGLLYQKIGKHEEAEPLFKQAIAIMKKALGATNPDYAQQLSNLANLYMETGRLNTAEPLLLEVKEINKKSVGIKHISYATTVSNLAYFYKIKGNFEEAEAQYIYAKNLKKEILGKNNIAYAQTAHNLAALYSEMGKLEKAIQYFDETRVIKKRLLGERSVAHALSLNNLGGVYRRMNNFDSAFAYCMASIAVNSENFDVVFPGFFARTPDDVDQYPTNRCSSNVAPDKFMDLCKLDIRNSMQFIVSLETLLNCTREDYEQNPTKDKLLVHYNVCKAAMKINEGFRNEFSGKKNKLRLLKENSAFVKGGIDAALELGGNEYLMEAFSFAEQNKSMLLADAVKGNRARILSDLPDSLALQEMKLLQNKERLKKKRYEAKTEEDKAKITNQENELNRKLDGFLKSLKGKYPKYHHLKYENITAKTTDVQALLDDKSMFLEFFATDSIIYLFALTKSTVKIYPLAISKTRLKLKIKTLRLALSDYKMLVKKAHKSYDLFTQSAYWFS